MPVRCFFWRQTACSRADALRNAVARPAHTLSAGVALPTGRQAEGLCGGAPNSPGPSRGGGLCRVLSNGETFAASAGAGGVGVHELEAFAVEAVGEVERGAHEVEQALFVHEDFYSFVFKHLVGGAHLVVEQEVIHEAGAASSLHCHADVVGRGVAFLHAQGFYLLFRFVGDGYHGYATGLSTTLNTVMWFVSRP
jgi:hypothetical protein